MLSLYFNARLTKSQLIEDKITSGYFYPVVYPRNADRFKSCSQYEVLITTISSYDRLKFEYAIFNLELDGASIQELEYLSSEIKRVINANLIKVNFKRPSTINSWIENIADMQDLIGNNKPVLVVMNHDHPFVDYDQVTFFETVEEVFEGNGDNFGKALYYSSAPEVISWAINGRPGVKFKKNISEIYSSGIINRWLDSCCVMTLETLSSIFSKAESTTNYIARFDWQGVSYRNLKLTTYVYPREFFRHFDGYGHVTGCRLLSDFQTKMNCCLKFPKEASIDEIASFYYQRWIDCFYLTVRDSINGVFFSNIGKKNKFVVAIEHSIEIFNITYIEKDCYHEHIVRENVPILKSALRNIIYFNCNDLYKEICIDNALRNRNLRSDIRGLKIVEFLYTVKNKIKEAASIISSAMIKP
jgi:hypothetical protein